MSDGITEATTTHQTLSDMFPNYAALKANGRCPFCGCNPLDEGFKDGISRKEFKISGMCQRCQDNFFTGE